jgi:hypothetical protein
VTAFEALFLKALMSDATRSFGSCTPLDDKTICGIGFSAKS